MFGRWDEPSAPESSNTSAVRPEAKGFIISRGARLTPNEVKWTNRRTLADAGYVVAFLRDHPARARRGYVICHCETPLALSDQVTALPWSTL
jgi:hypothetical protein